MVLGIFGLIAAELGAKLTSALSALTASTEVDDALVDHVLKDITIALLSSDVNVSLVKTLRTDIKSKINLKNLNSPVGSS
jgi:signal recognition particle subunit SRP54